MQHLTSIEIRRKNIPGKPIWDDSNFNKIPHFIKFQEEEIEYVHNVYLDLSRKLRERSKTKSKTKAKSLDPRQRHSGMTTLPPLLTPHRILYRLYAAITLNNPSVL
jgi:hypothetical protein